MEWMPIKLKRRPAKIPFWMTGIFMQGLRLVLFVVKSNKIKQKFIFQMGFIVKDKFVEKKRKMKKKYH
jgi:hypothetical protein